MSQSIEFSSLKDTLVVNYNPIYKEYNYNIAESSNERKAVLASFIGDYIGAIEYAERNVINVPTFELKIIDADKQEIEFLLDKNLEQDELVGEELKKILKRPENLEDLFSNYKPIPALNFIVSKAENNDFVLINEAHYSGQHRALTEKLLNPLWNKGFRYLALETLGYGDDQLIKRRYPESKTGYYTQEITFSNLLRKAISIGYEIVPYESRLRGGGTFRDSIQARNILDHTFDNKGKVLVHAGYSHINEHGDEQYQPMGAQLKKFSNRKILSVEQQVMTGFGKESNKVNSYYRYATHNYKINEPTVFIDTNQNVLVDPINQFGIDIQVYNPIVTFPNNRPNWLMTKDKIFVEVPEELKKFKEYLFQAFNYGESTNAIPLDQFILDTETSSFILSPGNFEIRIIDKNGNWTAKCSLKINVEN